MPTRLLVDWYYAEGNEQKGPVSDDHIRGLVVAGKVIRTTLVWHPEMTEWQPAENVSGLLKPPPWLSLVRIAAVALFLVFSIGTFVFGNAGIFFVLPYGHFLWSWRRNPSKKVLVSVASWTLIVSLFWVNLISTVFTLSLGAVLIFLILGVVQLGLILGAIALYRNYGGFFSKERHPILKGILLALFYWITIGLTLKVAKGLAEWVPLG